MARRNRWTPDATRHAGVLALPSHRESTDQLTCQRSAAWRDDAGSASVELAILVPIIMLLVFAGPQLALWYYAREAAQAAAQAGTRAASANNAPAGSGTQAADQYMSTTAKSTVASGYAQENNTATTVSVTVHATVPRVIPLPGLTFSVDVSASRARERFTNPGSP